MVTLNTVARIVSELPETSETSSATGLRWWVVKKKTIAWERPLRKSDLAALGDRAPKGTILGVWLPDLMMKTSLLAANPDVFFTTPHFDGHPSVLVPLAKVDAATLRAVLVEAWLGRAPKRLATAYLEERRASAAPAATREQRRADEKRCTWPGTDPLYVAYHDTEWGVPVHDDRVLFEFLVLEGAQAGLSWITILRKRDAYRRAFDGFDPARVARYTSRKVAALSNDEGIVRNRAKIASAITNARAFCAVQEEFGSFDAYQWRFVDGRPIQNRRRSTKDVPASTKESDAFSKDLKQRGFSFVGTTIVYAHMQAVGMVNDHLVDCFRCREVAKLR